MVLVAGKPHPSDLVRRLTRENILKVHGLKGVVCTACYALLSRKLMRKGSRTENDESFHCQRQVVEILLDAGLLSVVNGEAFS